jgi:hypothetical protein
VKDEIKFVKDLAAVLGAHEKDTEFGMTEGSLVVYVAGCLDNLRDILKHKVSTITLTTHTGTTVGDWYFCVGCGTKYFSPTGPADSLICDRCKRNGKVISYK